MARDGIDEEGASERRLRRSEGGENVEEDIAGAKLAIRKPEVGEAGVFSLAGGGSEAFGVGECESIRAEGDHRFILSGPSIGRFANRADSLRHRGERDPLRGAIRSFATKSEPRAGASGQLAIAAKLRARRPADRNYSGTGKGNG